MIITRAAVPERAIIGRSRMRGIRQGPRTARLWIRAVCCCHHSSGTERVRQRAFHRRFGASATIIQQKQRWRGEPWDERFAMHSPSSRIARDRPVPDCSATISVQGSAEGVRSSGEGRMINWHAQSAHHNFSRLRFHPLGSSGARRVRRASDAPSTHGARFSPPCGGCGER